MYTDIVAPTLCTRTSL